MIWNKDLSPNRRSLKHIYIDTSKQQNGGVPITSLQIDLGIWDLLPRSLT